jgi:hypothetical protein
MGWQAADRLALKNNNNSKTNNQSSTMTDKVTKHLQKVTSYQEIAIPIAYIMHH